MLPCKVIMKSYFKKLLTFRKLHFDITFIIVIIVNVIIIILIIIIIIIITIIVILSLSLKIIFVVIEAGYFIGSEEQQVS